MNKRNVVVAVGLIAALVIPATLVLANHSFPDVPTSAFYHDSVAAVKNAGVTSGCSTTKYCPNDSVTRGQMAVFLNKLGALGKVQGKATAPVVDAISVEGNFIQQGTEEFTLDPADVAPTACFTTNAAQDPNVNPFGSYAITYQIFDTPGSLDPEDVSVQVRDSDAPADVNDNVFDVCFAALSGNLQAGTYKTYFLFAVFIGQGIFASGASASEASQSPAGAGR